MPTFNTQADFPDGLSNITAIVQSNETPAFRISPQLVSLGTGNQEIDVARADDIIGLQFISSGSSLGVFYIVNLVMFGAERGKLSIRTSHNTGGAHTKTMTYTLEITSDKIKITNFKSFYSTNLADPKSGGYRLGSMVILRKEPA